MPPAPKPASQRRRRNKTVAVQKLAPAKHRKAPPLPGADAMLKSTLDYWAKIWRSPMSAVWLEADEPALERLAQLVDSVATGDASAIVLSEIRQLEDRFGLSPLARRRLQWELDQVTQAEPKQVEQGDDDRWLRVVSS